jgi:hypothetical protein
MEIGFVVCTFFFTVFFVGFSAAMHDIDAEERKAREERRPYVIVRSSRTGSIK